MARHRGQRAHRISHGSDILVRASVTADVPANAINVAYRNRLLDKSYRFVRRDCRALPNYDLGFVKVRHHALMTFFELQQSKDIVMRIVAIVTFALLGYWSAAGSVRAADSCKECRDFQRVCLQAHSKAACKTDYEICMKACKKK
jgi:hypothetical protein